MGIIEHADADWQLDERSDFQVDAVVASNSDRIRETERLIQYNALTIIRRLGEKGNFVRGPFVHERMLMLPGESTARIKRSMNVLTVDISGGKYHNASHLLYDIAANRVEQYAVFRQDGSQASSFGMGKNGKDTRIYSYEEALGQANIVLEQVSLDI